MTDLTDNKCTNEVVK